MRLHRSIASLLALALVTLPCTGDAAFESIYQVAQPLLVYLGESGVWIASVPYVGYDYEFFDSPSVILLTVAPNLLKWERVRQGPPRPENRNMASLIGVRFSIELVENRYGNKIAVLHGDTLRVSVSVPPVPQWNFDESPDEVISATLWCGLLNARQAWPAVRFVEYQIKAVPTVDFGKYSGVYSLGDIQLPGTLERWHDNTPLTSRCTRRVTAARDSVVR